MDATNENPQIELNPELEKAINKIRAKFSIERLRAFFTGRQNDSLFADIGKLDRNRWEAYAGKHYPVWRGWELIRTYVPPSGKKPPLRKSTSREKFKVEEIEEFGAEGKNTREIAEILDVPFTTASSYLFSRKLPFREAYMRGKARFELSNNKSTASNLIQKLTENSPVKHFDRTKREGKWNTLSNISSNHASR